MFYVRNGIKISLYMNINYIIFKIIFKQKINLFVILY